VHTVNSDRLRVPAGQTVRLADYDPADWFGFGDNVEAQRKLGQDILRLRDLQDVFYAARSYALLVVLQALDTAGKDGVIKHVMSGLNPQGVRVTSFRAPSAEELGHDYLWRHVKALPARGEIGIFNRSHYEEVITVRVHPELLANEHLPPASQDDGLWQRRFKDINAFERHLAHNGVQIVKFFLHISREEQRRRLLARIDTPSKNWKFQPDDLKQRAAWHAYQAAYEDALNHTSTEWAPWYIVPADHKWVTRAVVADVLVARLQSLKLEYPRIDDARRQVLQQARMALEAEASD
jgi:PPK2 family polyphosphate:nucleotide phosphotransferase